MVCPHLKVFWLIKPFLSTGNLFRMDMEVLGYFCILLTSIRKSVALDQLCVKDSNTDKYKRGGGADPRSSAVHVPQLPKMKSLLSSSLLPSFQKMAGFFSPSSPKLLRGLHYCEVTSGAPSTFDLTYRIEQK